MVNSGPRILGFQDSGFGLSVLGISGLELRVLGV